MTSYQHQQSAQVGNGWVDDALDAALPMPAGQREMAPAPTGDAGNFLSRLFDAEAREHRKIEQRIDNVAAEVAQANAAVGAVANHLVEESLQMEEGFEQSVHRHAGSRLATRT